jgi:hypothetical protein
VKSKPFQPINFALFVLPILIMLFLEYRPKFIVDSALRTTRLPFLNVPLLDISIFSFALLMYFGEFVAFYLAAHHSSSVRVAAKAFIAGWLSSWCWHILGWRWLLGRQ